jgi:hypothetical protein
LPQGRLRWSRFERDSLGFGCNKLAAIGNYHGTKEIRYRVGFSADQKLGGKLLSKKGGGEI